MLLLYYLLLCIMLSVLILTEHAHLLTTKHHLTFIEEPVLHILMVASAQIKKNTIVNHLKKIARTHTAVRWSLWWSHKRNTSRTRSCDCNCAGRPPPCNMPGPVNNAKTSSLSSSSLRRVYNYRHNYHNNVSIHQSARILSISLSNGDFTYSV